LSKISRRQSLKAITAGAAGAYSLITFSPLKTFAETLARGMVSDATSRNLKNQIFLEPSRKLLHINLSGAPTRWYFDHLLKPSDSHTFVPNPMVCTELLPRVPENPLAVNSVYKTAYMNGYNFPSLWLNDVPMVGGGKRPMADLQKNMLMIRGCDMQIDGHFLNTMKQVTNTQDDLSITGLAADGSKTFMPAISMGSCAATSAFKGRVVRKPIEIPYDHKNYLDFLLAPFYEKSATESELIEAEEAAMKIIEGAASSNQNGAATLYNEKQQAREIIRKKIRNLNDVYTTLVKKYEDLLVRSFSETRIKGISEFDYTMPRMPLKVSGNVSKEDFTRFLNYYYFAGKTCESDFEHLSKQVTQKKLAQQFAIAEFCLTENLSSSITISPYSAGSFSDKFFDFIGCDPEHYYRSYDEAGNHTVISRRTEKVKAVQKDAKFDSHFLGFLPEFWICNYFYLGFSAALLELTDRLKQTKVDNTNLFNETVIHIASEFEREPVLNQFSGTDHNYRAGAVSMISGMVNGPLLVGNIYSDTTDDSRRGTRGDSAPMESLGGKKIDHRNVLSTLSEMLRVERITSRAKSLVEVKNGQVTGVIEKPLNLPPEKKYEKA